MPLRRRPRTTCAPSPRSGPCTSTRTVRNRAKPPRCASAGSPWGSAGTGSSRPRTAAARGRGAAAADLRLAPEPETRRASVRRHRPARSRHDQPSTEAADQARRYRVPRPGHGVGEAGGGQRSDDSDVARSGGHAHPDAEAARRPRHRPLRRREIRRAADHRRCRTDPRGRRSRARTSTPVAGTRTSTAPHEPVPIAVARHTACDGAVQRVISDEGRPHRRHPHPRPRLQPPPAQGHHPPRRRMHHPGMPRAGRVVRDPPRHRPRPRRTDAHRQRRPALLAPPPHPRHQRLGDPDGRMASRTCAARRGGTRTSTGDRRPRRPRGCSTAWSAGDDVRDGSQDPGPPAAGACTGR